MTLEGFFAGVRVDFSDVTTGDVSWVILHMEEDALVVASRGFSSGGCSSEGCSGDILVIF